MKFLFSFLFLVSTNTNSQQPSVANLKLVVPKLQHCTSVKDQANSSTCWSFGSNSFLESEVYLIKKEKVDLSEMFIARYSYVRKVETYLQNKGSNFFTPGGQFHDVVWVIKKYGIVPEAAYNGNPHHKNYHNHAVLDTVIKNFTYALLLKHVTKLTSRHYMFLDSVLDYHLGKVPATFMYNSISYNPKTFLKNYLQLNVDDYIEITSYTHHPFYKPFVLENKYNWTGDAYYNVPLNDLIAITNQAILNNYSVSWSGDVDEVGFNFEKGISYLPKTVVKRVEERQNTFNDSSSSMNHMMHIVAITKDKFKKNWYYVKNSWGNNTNALHGFLFMSEDYFAIKTGAIVVNKKIIPKSIKTKMGL
jgi:bleomycin hydrolase